jgi:hypothetical protein
MDPSCLQSASCAVRLFSQDQKHGVLLLVSTQAAIIQIDDRLRGLVLTSIPPVPILSCASRHAERAPRREWKVVQLVDPLLLGRRCLRE